MTRPVQARQATRRQTPHARRACGSAAARPAARTSRLLGRGRDADRLEPSHGDGPRRPALLRSPLVPRGVPAFRSSPIRGLLARSLRSYLAPLAGSVARGCGSGAGARHARFAAGGFGSGVCPPVGMPTAHRWACFLSSHFGVSHGSFVASVSLPSLRSPSPRRARLSVRLVRGPSASGPDRARLSAARGSAAASVPRPCVVP